MRSARGSRLASRIGFPKEQTPDDGDFRVAPILPGCTSELRECRGTVGEVRGGVERRTDVAPEGRVRPVGGVVRAAGARGGRASQTAKFSPGRALDFTESGSIRDGGAAELGRAVSS